MSVNNVQNVQMVWCDQRLLLERIIIFSC